MTDVNIFESYMPLKDLTLLLMAGGTLRVLLGDSTVPCAEMDITRISTNGVIDAANFRQLYNFHYPYPGQRITMQICHKNSDDVVFASEVSGLLPTDPSTTLSITFPRMESA